MTDVRRWTKFWWQDWQRDPALRVCSLAARGLWMELLCIAHEGTPVGHVTINGRAPSVRQIAMISGVAEKEAERLLGELENAGVFSRTAENVIYSRRMVRDFEYEGRHRDWGKMGGNPDLVPGAAPKAERIARLKPDKNPRLFTQVFEEAGGMCQICGVHLRRDAPYAPNAYQLDHILEVRNGGTNDRSNLRALCRKCNLTRNLIPAADGIDNPPSYDPVKGSSDGRDKFLEAESESERKTPPVRPPSPTAAASPAAPAPARLQVERTGTRLPADWEPGPQLIEFAAGLGLDGASVAERFRDYWRAQPGARGRKSDWPATWRNWCRRESERPAPRAAPRETDGFAVLARQFRAAELRSGTTPTANFDLLASPETPP